MPSWTDRIMFLGEDIKGLRYGRVEVDLSDHKPVFLVALCKVLHTRCQVSVCLHFSGCHH